MDLRLSECALEEEVEIVKIENAFIASKLIEMGLNERVRTKIVLIAPLGDPIALDINGFVLSIRRSEAEQIMVKKVVKN